MRAILVSIVILATAGSSFAQDDSWSGKKILVKKAGVMIVKNADAGKQVGLGLLDAGVVYHVAAEKDTRIQVEFRKDIVGWLDKSDAVLFQDAREYFTERIHKNSKDVFAYLSRGSLWFGDDGPDLAIRDYTEAIRLDPQATTFTRRGYKWIYKKDFDNAITDFTEAIRRDPKLFDPYFIRGYLWNEKKEYGKVIADYTEAIRIDPKHAEAHNRLAWWLATSPDGKVRDGKRAIEIIKKAMELDTDKAVFFADTLAAAYAETGNFEEAVRCQEQALEHPTLKTDADARRRLELYRKKKPYRQE